MRRVVLLETTSRSTSESEFVTPATGESARYVRWQSWGVGAEGGGGSATLLGEHRILPDIVRPFGRGGGHSSLRDQAPDDDPDEPQPKAVPRKILSILKPTNKYWGTGPARPVQDQRGHRSYLLVYRGLHFAFGSWSSLYTSIDGSCGALFDSLRKRAARSCFKPL